MKINFSKFFFAKLVECIIHRPPNYSIEKTHDLKNWPLFGSHNQIMYSTIVICTSLWCRVQPFITADKLGLTRGYEIFMVRGAASLFFKTTCYLTN